MKKIILLLMVTALTVNCSSDSNSDPIQPSLFGSKIKRIEEYQHGSIIKTFDYQYNALGNITKMVVNDRTKIYKTTFSYNSSNLMVSWNLEEYYVSDPASKIVQTNTLEYDNGKITNICIDRIDNTFSTTIYQADRILYSYDTGIHPTSIMHYSPVSSMTHDNLCSDVIYEDNEETFEYLNENAIFYSMGSSGFSNTYNRIEYDTKNNPLAMIKPIAFKNAIGRSSKNNMTKVMVYNTSDDSLEGTSKFENSYNNNNFLVQAIERYYPAGNTTPSVTTTIKYYYY